MEKTLFKVIDICKSKNIESSFISELHQNGLIEITIIEEQEFMEESDLVHLEKFSAWYYDLEINMEGIEVVNHLLQKIEDLQNEIKALKQ